MARVFLSGPLYEVMVTKGLDAQQLATKSGREKRAITRLLQGKTSNLAKQTRELAAIALEIDKGDLDRLIHQQVQFARTQVLMEPLYCLAKYAALGLPNPEELKGAGITRHELQNLREHLDRTLGNWPRPKKKRKLRIPVPSFPPTSS